MRNASVAELWFAATRRAIRRFGWMPATVFLAHVVGARVFDAYGRWPAFDIPMHFFGGVAIAFLISGTLVVLREAELTLPVDMPLHLALVFGLTCAATVIWEFAEWSADHLLGTVTQLSLDDTLLDILLGLLGGCALLAHRVRRQFRQRKRAYATRTTERHPNGR